MELPPPIRTAVQATVRLPTTEPLPEVFMASIDNSTVHPSELFGRDLSVELINNILSLLDARSLGAASLVNRSWYHLCASDELWSSHCGGLVRGRLPEESWKRTYIEAWYEINDRREARMRQAQAQVDAWVCHAACGMMGLPPREEERPERDVSLVTDVFPVLGWSRHPDSDMSNPVATLSVDHMVKVASLYTRFHDSFVHTKGTDDSAFFERALGRYYAFMMLKTKHPGVLLVPTHDIEFAWQAHLVRPHMYREDLERHLHSGVIDHAVRCTDADMAKLPEALKQTCALWFDEFGQEYFEGAGPRGEGASFNRQGDIPPYFLDCGLSARVETEGDRRMYHDISSVQANTKSPYPASACPFGLNADHLRKDMSWYPLLMRHMKEESGHLYFSVNEKAIKRCIKAYDRFLFLAMKLLNGGKCSEKMIHPSYSIDLVWHCHMLHPAEYEKDMKKYVGMMPVHEPWPDACGDLEIVAKEWKGEYGVEISKELALRTPGEPLGW